MSETQAQHAILGAVARLQRRAAFTTFVRVGIKALFYTLLAGALLTPFVPEAAVFPGLVLFGSLAVVIAAVVTVALQDSDVAVAKRYDDHAGTKDRLATSLQLLGGEGPMVQALLQDTAVLTQKVEPQRIYPLRFPRETLPLLLIPLLVGLILFVPSMVAEADPYQRAVDEALDDQAAKISDFVAKERGNLASSSGKRKVLAKLEDLSAELTRKKLGKKDAMAKLAKLMEELKEEDQKEEEERLRLRRAMKNFQTNEKNKDLADQMNKGNYQDAANRIKKLLEELRRKLNKKKKKKKKTKLDLEELQKLREEIKKLEDVQAKLLRMMNLEMDMNMRGEVLDFLKDVEGDLSELPEDEIEDRKFVRLGELNPNQNQNQGGPIPRMKRRQMLLPPQAGRGTTDEFQGEEKRTENERDNHKVKVRESKGQSSFSQVQVADDGSRSAIEAKEIYQAERRAAEDTMQRQEVPAGYREYLRRYFDGMQPDERKEK